MYQENRENLKRQTGQFCFINNLHVKIGAKKSKKPPYHMVGGQYIIITSALNWFTDIEFLMELNTIFEKCFKLLTSFGTQSLPQPRYISLGLFHWITHGGSEGLTCISGSQTWGVHGVSEHTNLGSERWSQQLSVDQSPRYYFLGLHWFISNHIWKRN